MSNKSLPLGPGAIFRGDHPVLGKQWENSRPLRHFRFDPHLFDRADSITVGTETIAVSYKGELHVFPVISNCRRRRHRTDPSDDDDAGEAERRRRLGRTPARTTLGRTTLGRTMAKPTMPGMTTARATTGHHRHDHQDRRDPRRGDVFQRPAASIWTSTTSTMRRATTVRPRCESCSCPATIRSSAHAMAGTSSRGPWRQ